MKRISPLIILGLLSVVLGLTVAILTGGYLIILGAYLIGFALFLFLLNWLTKKTKTRKAYWILQVVLSVTYIAFLTFSYLDWNKHNLIVFPTGFQGDGGIVFGIEGYPELPEMSYWKRTIEVPSNGVLITSTKEEDLPNKFQFQYKDGSYLDFRDSTWDFSYSSEFPCILTNSVIKHYSFTIGKSSNTNFQELLSKLCDSINQGKLVSAYDSEYSPIVNEVETPYLHLQNRGLSKLPKDINTLQIKEIILTGNNFTEFPNEVLDMPQLEELLIGHNPVSKLPDNLESLKNLKRLSINATLIKRFPSDLSVLENLETIGLDHNEFKELPESILTILNLKRLGVNNNKLTNLKFIDERLEGLESIYLYSNEIKQIDCHIENLKSLKELLIFDNQIDSIPDCIGSLTNLEKLEIWSNPIKYVSPEIQKLTNLKSMRIDKDNLTEEQMEAIRNWLPNCEINFQ
ncbi:leucine-rich repeat domain-containing protein [Pontibacter harenae]|uniref:leucine-rich repeat domain-containing protein n=1 Tax=Pontibacter harenae TaxID=2894083 RepID=UPI001E3A4260|nr:leucine-rich repeat domain-containing protein [Pontibacter harenae]MCC9167684.1 leucine-rich repeat domain-containing protein [Pontibacter harenae]